MTHPRTVPYTLCNLTMNRLHHNPVKSISNWVLRCLSFSLLILYSVTLTVASAGSNMESAQPSDNNTRLDIAHLIALGDSYKSRAMTDSALECYTKITERVNLSSPLGDREKAVNAFLSRGNLLFTAGRFTEALETYIIGLKITESCPEGAKAMNFYNNIGNIYCYFGDYEKGTAYYETAYSLRNPHSDRKVMSNLLTNMTGTYCLMGKLDKARRTFALAAKTVEASDSDNRYMMLYNKGLILDLEGNVPEAARHFIKACGEADTPYYRCHVYEKLYLLYKKSGERDSTFLYLTKLHNEAEKHGFNDFIATSLKGLADWYDPIDKRLSRNYKDSLLDLRDSLMGRDETVREFYRIRNIQNLYELGKIEKRIDDLEAERQIKEQEARSQRIIILIVSVSLIAIFALLVLVYLQKRKLYRSYNELFEFNRNLTANRTDQAEATSQEPQTFGYDRNALAEKIKNFMENSSDFMSPDFSLSRLAELVDSNQKYVSQVINDIFGHNFTDFVNERRVREAQALLISPEKCANLTLEAIGQKVGFGSQSTFIRAFRKFTGLTPSIFRKIALQKAQSLGNS